MLSWALTFLVVAIIADRIKEKDAAKGFVLDGFPRTVPQARALAKLLAARGASEISNVRSFNVGYSQRRKASRIDY